MYRVGGSIQLLHLEPQQVMLHNRLLLALDARPQRARNHLVLQLPARTQYSVYLLY